MIWESLKMAVVSLRSAKMRSFLTMLGVIIGISSVVAISAIGEGVKQSVNNQIGGLGTNLITVTSGKVISTSGGKTTFNPGSNIGTSTLTNKDVTTVQETDHVTGAAQLMIISGIPTAGGKSSESSIITATTPEFNVIRNKTLEEGRFLQASDGTNYVAVLGNQTKTDLFGDGKAVGQIFNIRGANFKVVGVMKSEQTSSGSLFGSSQLDNVIYIPVDAAKKLTNNEVQVNRIIAQADTAGNVNPTVEAIKRALKDNHGGQEDFSVLTQADIVSAAGNILNLLTTFIAAIASIALVVGGIGIMNIMLVSVTERTREIGIRKAVGATRLAIMTQFLIEAVTLSLVGGLFGLLGAVALGRGVAHAAGITPVFTLRIVIIAFGVSTAIGVIFGLAPAVKAARKRPIEALRYE